VENLSYCLAEVTNRSVACKAASSRWQYVAYVLLGLTMALTAFGCPVTSLERQLAAVRGVSTHAAL
jgi:hypothetical protein